MDNKIIKIIEQATELGITDPLKIRNLKIYEKFRHYRDVDKMKYEEAVRKLSEEFFLSYPRIENIIIIGKTKNNKSIKAGS
jgi:hypothetical protein